MGTDNVAAAFAAALSNNDSEELIVQVEAWANKPYRSPENVLEVVPCVQSGIHAFFARKEDECRRAWKTAEAQAWAEARATFDAGMRAFVTAIVKQPNADRPAIGAGWGSSSQPTAQPRRFNKDSWGRPIVPQHDAVPA